MPSIELREVVKQFGGAEPAVDGLNLDIPDGEFMCLLGPSGCGKTTTLRMIAGLERPTSGQVSMDGRMLASPAQGAYVPPERRGMGLVFQNYALWPHLTVRENAAFGLKMMGLNRHQQAERVKQILEMLQIDELIERYPSELSGGQQQRVALARMLAVGPDVLLLDEPLSNLDASLRLAMRSELKALHDETKSTVVFVTHDQLEAMTLATKIAVMNEGRLQQVGDPMSIYNRPANRFVAEFLGSPQMNFLEVAEGEGAALGRDAARYVKKRLPETPASPASTAISAIGVRPEALHMATDGADMPSDAWTARLEVGSILPTGATWVVEVGCEDERLFALNYSPPGLRRGDKVDCWVEPEHLHAFGPDGTRSTEVDQALQGFASPI